MVSGAFTDVTINVPFEPIATFLNGNHRLNIANLGKEHIFTETGIKNFSAADLEVFVDELPSETWMRVEHCWIAPDVVQNPPTPDTRVSKTHYWKVDADLPDGFLAKAIFNYRGPALPELDLDLVAENEDSIVLVYRKDASEEWRLAEPATKVIFLPTDGEGFIRCDSLIAGEYAFANGEFSGFVSTYDIRDEVNIKVFPNPTHDQINIQGSLSKARSLHLVLSDASGKKIVTESLGNVSQNWTHELNLGAQPNGVYILEIFDNNGELIRQEKLVRSAP